MAVTVDVELPRTALAQELSESLATHGLHADVVEDGDSCTLQIRYAREEQERLVGDVAHAVESWIGDKLLPLVVERGDSGIVVRPPSG